MQLTAESFQQMMDALSLAPVDLRRRRTSRRIPIRAEMLVTKPERGGGTSVGTVIDIVITDASPGGLGFTTHTPLDPGDELLLHLPSKHGRHLTVRCQVLHCHEPGRDGVCHVGAKFVSVE